MTQPYETALIIEDDINWDIHLRHSQIPLLAQAFHSVLEHEIRSKGFIAPPPASNETTTKIIGMPPRPNTLDLKSKARDDASTPYERKSYWPDPRYWELLHMGHCGDFFSASKLAHVVHTIYPDPNMPSFAGLLIHQSIRPLCTFAYAVTRRSAARILADFATEEENHGTQAYDVRILEACRDLGWKCWSANPELFHHLDDQASEIQALNLPLRAGEAGGAPPPREGLSSSTPSSETSTKPTLEDVAKSRARGTPNVGCGIRGLVERLGASKRVREMVRLASEVDGMCPMAMEEVDGLRGQIVEKGRSLKELALN
jgi:hypothetical protein